MRCCSILLALCLCTAAAAATVPPAKKCKAATGRPLGGGWAPTSAVPKDVYAAVLHRLAKKHPLCQKPSIKLLAACSQVVAGINYEVRLRIRCPAEGFKVKVHAIVWDRLPPQSPKVTSLRVAGAVPVPGRRLAAAEVLSTGLGLKRIPPRPKKLALEARRVPRRPFQLRKRS